jgi:hypothetical protein
MTKLVSVLAAALLTATLAGVSFAAEPAPATEREIAHLFAYLQASGCDFFRNGSWHNSTEAAFHLNRKYRDLLSKGPVPSAEAFIEKAASKSGISGKAYRVRCGSRPPVNSADWFGAELERYRGEQP